MLGANAISDALMGGEVGISYEFDLTADSPTRLKEPVSPDPSNPNALGTTMFGRHFFGDRLGLTLGPIVVSDSIRRLPGRVLFRNRPGHFDLTKSNGEIDIMPGENLAVHSLEYIRLGSKTAAYVLPRLTLATVGLVVMPTYIDPYWEGILQLYIANLSSQPHRLKFGERIAICRFYKIEGAVDDPEAKSRFAQKSHHYGLNWRRILDSDAEVQPRRKSPIPAAVYRERFRAKAVQFLSNWHNFVGIAAGASLIAALVAYGKFESSASQIDKLTAQVQELKGQIAQDRTVQQDIDRSVPQSGTIDAQLNASETITTQEVTLERRPAPGADVWLLPVTGGAEVNATGKLLCGSECRLRVTFERTTRSTKAINTEFRWLILSR